MADYLDAPDQPSGVDLIVPADEQGPFTLEWLNSTFEKHVILQESNRIVRPDEPDMLRLSANLNWLHNWIKAADLRRALDVRIKEGAEVARAFADRLEGIRSCLFDPALMYEELQGGDLNDILTATIANLRASSMRLKNIEATPPAERGTQWRRELVTLMELFREAMKRNNRKKDGNVAGCGTAQNTPLNRFICAVVPIMTGEEVNANMVAEAISTERKKVRISVAARDKF